MYHYPDLCTDAFPAGMIEKHAKNLSLFISISVEAGNRFPEQPREGKVHPGLEYPIQFWVPLISDQSDDRDVNTAVLLISDPRRYLISVHSRHLLNTQHYVGVYPSVMPITYRLSLQSTETTKQ